jgi:hypothetical protein
VACIENPYQVGVNAPLERAEKFFLTGICMKAIQKQFLSSTVLRVAPHPEFNELTPPYHSLVPDPLPQRPFQTIVFVLPTQGVWADFASKAPSKRRLTRAKGGYH